MGFEIGDSGPREERARVAAGALIRRRDPLRRVTLFELVGRSENAPVDADVEPTGGAVQVTEQVLAGPWLGKRCHRARQRVARAFALAAGSERVGRGAEEEARDEGAA